jgi:hypothetical protein
MLVLEFEGPSKEEAAKWLAHFNLRRRRCGALNWSRSRDSAKRFSKSNVRSINLPAEKPRWFYAPAVNVVTKINME